MLLASPHLAAARPFGAANTSVAATRRKLGYAMDDSNIRTAVAAWLSNSASAEATYGPISTWDTSGVTDMARLFCASETDGNCASSSSGLAAAAASFNEDISAWDTSGVTTMIRMFYEASSFNQPLSGWQVDKVTHMNYMFGEASAFNQDIGDWAVDSVIDMKYMFYLSLIHI